MKQQVIFLKGGNPKENYSSYYDYLKLQDYNPDKINFKNWKYFLGENLGDNYMYHIVSFPDTNFADYEAWKIVFEETILFLNDDLIIVGTSLGGSFITKYLSENKISINIKKLILLAPAIFDDHETKLGSFVPDTRTFSKINEQCGSIIIYHSIDDKVVPFSGSEKYLKLFPNAIFRKFTDRGHFNFEKRIIEVEKDIQK